MMTKRKLSENIGRLIVKSLLLMVAFSFIISANTLYCNVGDRSLRIRFEALCFACAAVVVLLLWLKAPISKSFLQHWVLYAIYVVAIYVLVSIFTGLSGGLELLLAAAFLSLAPGLCKLLIDTDEIRFLVDAFIAMVGFLAAASLVLWILGPVSGVLPSNCTVQTSWGTNGYFVDRPGWFGLVYITQYLDASKSLVRNTGIFCEAPMYSYVLSVALIFESYLRQRPRFLMLMLLALAIVTTTSTTGMIVVLMVAVELLNAFANRFRPTVRAAIKLSMVVAAIVSGLLAYFLFSQKMATDSGAIRADDFVAGFKAWTNNILLGNGFSDKAIQANMSAFRGNNVGFSNSLMEVLAHGGITWFISFFVCGIGFFRMGNKKAYGMLCFLFVWTVTIVSYLPLTLFCFGLGACALFSNGEAFVERRCDGRELRRNGRATSVG